jgi:hypothetical protein
MRQTADVSPGPVTQRLRARRASTRRAGQSWRTHIRNGPNTGGPILADPHKKWTKYRGRVTGNDTFTVNTPDYPDCGTGGDYVDGSLSTTAGGGSFDCSFPDGPATTDVKIRVTDSDGASDTDTEDVVVVEVLNVDPVVTLTGPSSVVEGSTETYSYTTADDGAPETFSRDAQSCDGGTLTGATFNPVNGSGSFDCTYADGPTSHNPSVTISDGDGGFDSDSVAVTVTNVAPTIAISGNANVNEGSLYTATLGAVTDPGTDTVTSYVVHWGDGSDDTYSSNGAKTHTYADGDSNHAVTVDLVDEDGTFLDRANAHSVHVVNVAPTIPSLNSPADNASTSDNTPTFDWDNSTDPASVNDTITYRIQIDDNCDFSSPERDQTTSSSDFTPVLSLADGTYCWRVNASDEDGGTSAYSSVRHLTIDAAAPTVTINQAAGQDDPTNSSPIHFTAVFNEPATGFMGSDVTITGTAGGSKTVVSTDSGDHMTYDVAVSGMTNGTVVASIGANGAQDAAGNGNAASTSGDNSVNYDNTSPTVTVNQAIGQVDPTSSSPIHFTAVFSEAVSGFQNGDVMITGTAGGSASVTDSGDSRTFDIAVNGMTTSGTVTVTIAANKANDAAGNPNAASTSTDNTVTWNQQTQNAAPVVTITSPTFGQLYAKGSANVSLSASFTDPDAGQTHTCLINWDDGVVQSGVVNETSRTCTKAHTFSSAGVYTINVTICDNLGACGTATVWVVVYDPSAGFVTGGGWINVDPGSYPADPTLSGRANFGFNSKYKNGGGPPSGETEFNFEVGNFNFHSDSYQWLVVSSFKAQYRGTGSVNGVSGYDFRVTGYDGQVSGGGGIDKFRIKITRNGQTVFDNRMGQPEDIDQADPQQIAGGSIVIHRA